MGTVFYQHIAGLYQWKGYESGSSQGMACLSPHGFGIILYISDKTRRRLIFAELFKIRMKRILITLLASGAMLISQSDASAQTKTVKTTKTSTATSTKMGKSGMSKKTMVKKSSVSTSTTMAAPKTPLMMEDKKGMTPSGVMYDLKTSNHLPGPNDVIVAHLRITNFKDSVLLNTMSGAGETGGRPVPIALQAHQSPGDLMDVLPMLGEGGSGTIKIPTDTLFKGNESQRPAYLAPGTTLNYEIKVVEIISKAEQTSRALSEQRKALGAEDANMEKYIKSKGLKATRTASGMYIAMTQTGTGAKPTKGQTVSVHYTGTLLDGTKFDSSRDRGTPFDFPLGAGQVIKGWDEGIGMINKGGKAVLIIPSSMGYGANAAGSIPANSILIFDVELMDIK